MKYLLFIFFVLIKSVSFADTVTGVMLGDKDISLKAKSQGEIIRILVAEGTPVKVGDVIAIIDDAQEQIEFDLAKIEFSAAKNDYHSTKGLAKFVSKEEVIKKKNEFLKKKSNMEIKKLNLENTKVVSPITGIIAKSYFQVGETVSAGDKVADVVNMESLVMSIYVPIQDISHFVLNNQDVVFRTLQSQGAKYKAKIDFVSPVADSASGTVKVRLKFPNQKNSEGHFAIRPGTMAFVDYKREATTSREPAQSK